MALTYHYRHLGLDDPGLLEGDFRKRPAQHVAMVQTYVGNDTKHGRYDIGAVQTSAEPGLQNCDVDITVCKPIQSKESGDLEERHVKMIESILPLTDKRPHIRLRNQHI